MSTVMPQGLYLSDFRSQNDARRLALAMFFNPVLNCAEWPRLKRQQNESSNLVSYRRFPTPQLADIP